MHVYIVDNTTTLHSHLPFFPFIAALSSPPIGRARVTFCYFFLLLSFHFVSLLAFALCNFVFCCRQWNRSVCVSVASVLVSSAASHSAIVAPPTNMMYEV